MIWIWLLFYVLIEELLTLIVISIGETPATNTACPNKSLG